MRLGLLRDLCARYGCVLLLLLSSRTAVAQTPRDGTLVVTVVDQTRAVLPDATVVVTGLEEATKAAVIAAVKTSDRGIATIPGLKPGRYLVQAEFPGFDVGLLNDVRVRAGENKHVIVLAIQGLQDSITVGRDAQESAADRRGGAVMRVDSFEGGKLPSKAQIKSIHITRDAFAAENHSAGGLFIDIITQPGIGPIRGGGRYNLRDGSLSGRSPFTPIKGPERSQNYGTNFAGSLI